MLVKDKFKAQQHTNHMLTKNVLEYLNKSVLCWLATASSEGVPNVSPKEVFTDFQQQSIIIANIASPNTVKNIKANPQVCLSFIDILIQKGFQIKGTAEIITAKHSSFQQMEGKLLEMTKGKFPFSSITQISPEKIKPILAPSYLLYPETTSEEKQIELAKIAYSLTIEKL